MIISYSYSDNFSNDGFTIGCEDTDMYDNGEDRYNEPTTGKHQNAPYTMNTNECGPEDYIIPIYSETSSEKLTSTFSENLVHT